MEKPVDQDEYVAGDTLTYSFVVTNTGTTTLSDLDLSEVDFTGTGELSEFDCGSGVPETLAPGQSFECTATYQVTDEDVEAGELSNTAHVSASDANDTTIDDSDDAVSTPAADTGGEEDEDGDDDGDDDNVGANTGLPGAGEPNWALIGFGSVLGLIGLTIAVARLRRRA